MGSRNKIQVASQIGRFGIGFVSVYQITDSPVVRSGNTEMRLDPVQGQGVTRKIEAEQGTEFELPWARSEEHTSELQSLMRNSYAVFCSKTKNTSHITKSHY